MQRLGFARAFLGAQPSPDYRGRKVFIKISCGRMPEKREMDSYKLYALAFHNPDLLFSQPVKLVD